jgi:hypothetical protein
MSFRFSVVKEEWRDEDGKRITDDEELLRLLYDRSSDFPSRILREVKVPELGPVVFPAYDQTDVSVRSGAQSFDLVKLLESRSGQKTVARALFMAERATLGHNERLAEPEETPLERDVEEEPQAGPALPEQDTTGTEPVRNAATRAAEMRQRLESLNRST